MEWQRRYAYNVHFKENTNFKENTTRIQLFYSNFLFSTTKINLHVTN